MNLIPIDKIVDKLISNEKLIHSKFLAMSKQINSNTFEKETKEAEVALKNRIIYSKSNKYIDILAAKLDNDMINCSNIFKLIRLRY